MKINFILASMGGSFSFFLCLFFGVYGFATGAAMFEHLAVGAAISAGFYSAYNLWETGSFWLMLAVFLYSVAMGTGGYYAAFI